MSVIGALEVVAYPKLHSDIPEEVAAARATRLSCFGSEQYIFPTSVE